MAGNLKDIPQGALQSLVGDRSQGAAGCAIATTKTKVKTVNNITFLVGGFSYALAGTDNFFVHTDLTVQPASTTRAYLLCVDKTGAALVVRETAPLVLSPGNYGVTTGKLPELPAGYAPIGAIKVVTDSTHTFTPNTTNHDAAGVTTTYYDLGCMVGGVLP